MGGRDNSKRIREMESAIEALLLSPDEEVRALGFKLLDSTLRKIVLGILRGRIRNKGAELNSEELADAWQEAMLNLMKIVSDDQLQQRGALIGLLLCLVSCRYIDQVRRRLRRDEDSDPDNGFVHFRVDQAHDLDELRIVVVDAMATLSEREQLVMQAFYGLFDEYDSPPSVADVREELQLQQIECSKGSVRSALQRGRAKMRCILKQRGYGNEP